MPVGGVALLEGSGTVQMRTLGGSGITVSSYCLGAMMFGQWGNPDTRLLQPHLTDPQPPAPSTLRTAARNYQHALDQLTQQAQTRRMNQT